MGGRAVAVGAAVGPIVGGFFTTFFSWRWAFRTELLIVIIVLVLSRFLSRDRLPEHRPRFDFLGAILSILGWSTIVFGILLSQNYGLFLAKEPFVIGNLEIAPLGLSITPVLVGIGFLLIQWIRLTDYRSAGIAVWFIAITVAILDFVSAKIRERYV